MTTDNKRVAAYLPQDLYEYLEKFKNEHDLSESKAITSILAAHFGVAYEVSQQVVHQFVTVKQFKELEAKVAQLSSLLSEPSNRETSSSKGVLQGELAPNSETNELLSELNSELEPFGPLGATALSRRLGKGKSFVSDAKRRYRENLVGLTKFLKGHDPDGISWQYLDSTRRYHPVL